MSHQRIRSTTVQTFYVAPAKGPARPAQVFAYEWRQGPRECLARISADFATCREAMSFSGTYKGAQRTCWVADHRFDSRPKNPRAQEMLSPSRREVFRGDVIIEMRRKIWTTYWVSASVEAMLEVVDNLSLPRVAIGPEGRRRGGCYIAAPDDDGGIIIPTLLLAVPEA